MDIKRERALYTAYDHRNVHLSFFRLPPLCPRRTLCLALRRALLVIFARLPASPLPPVERFAVPLASVLVGLQGGSRFSATWSSCASSCPGSPTSTGIASPSRRSETSPTPTLASSGKFSCRSSVMMKLWSSAICHGVISDPLYIMNKACKLHDEYIRCFVEDHEATGTALVVSNMHEWQPLPPGLIKLNCNAGIARQRMVTEGHVARYNQGAILFSSCMQLSCRS